MPDAFHELVRDQFPNLTADNYRITSLSNWNYNCVAWAIGITDAWWWPTAGRFWPPNVPREETVDAFIDAFETKGFTPCTNVAIEPGIEKIALFSAQSIPTHAARQLFTGWWTSKLGPDVDIEHTTPESVGGGIYGSPVVYLSRPIAH